MGRIKVNTSWRLRRSRRRKRKLKNHLIVCWPTGWCRNTPPQKKHLLNIKMDLYIYIYGKKGVSFWTSLELIKFTPSRFRIFFGWFLLVLEQPSEHHFPLDQRSTCYLSPDWTVPESTETNRMSWPWNMRLQPFWEVEATVSRKLKASPVVIGSVMGWLGFGFGEIRPHRLIDGEITHLS